MLLWSAWRELQREAAELSYACDCAVACWRSRPFRKNSFVAASRHSRHMKQLFVLALELDLEPMGEREKCCFHVRIKNTSSQLSCAARAAAVGLCFTEGCEGERGVVCDGTQSRSACGGQSPRTVLVPGLGCLCGRKLELLTSTGVNVSFRTLHLLHGCSGTSPSSTAGSSDKAEGCDFSLKTK